MLIPGWSPWSGTLWRWRLFLPPHSTPRLSGLAAAAPSPLHSTCGLYLPGTEEGKRSRSAWQWEDKADTQRNEATHGLWSCRSRWLGGMECICSPWTVGCWGWGDLSAALCSPPWVLYGTHLGQVKSSLSFDLHHLTNRASWDTLLLYVCIHYSLQY